MRKWVRWIPIALALALLTMSLAGCRQKSSDESPNASPAPAASGAPESGTNEPVATPSLPDTVAMVDGQPQIVVYNVNEEDYEEMNLEKYVMGVLAGEMRNDWPMEALKAQAILARTFVLKFLSEKTSQYPAADISTDIKEAQAYDASQVNDRIEKAVNDTTGQVMSYHGEFPYAWFFAHAAGVTELPSNGLEYDQPDPGYTQSVESPDSDKAPTSVKNWTASFSASEVVQACKEAGVTIASLSSIELGEKSESGRTINFLINGESVSAPSLRLYLDSTKLKSTMLDSVKLSDGTVTFTGRGYGHGVGMSQWGAYGMAEAGSSAEDIVNHYFKDVDIVRLWS